jgi:hypothetical protein
LARRERGESLTLEQVHPLAIKPAGHRGNLLRHAQFADESAQLFDFSMRNSVVEDRHVRTDIRGV